VTVFSLSFSAHNTVFHGCVKRPLTTLNLELTRTNCRPLTTRNVTAETTVMV